MSLIYGDTEWDLAGRVVDTKLFESRKEETVIIPNQVESSELLGSQPVGSSRGWLISSSYRRTRQGIVHTSYKEGGRL